MPTIERAIDFSTEDRKSKMFIFDGKAVTIEERLKGDTPELGVFWRVSRNLGESAALLAEVFPEDTDVRVQAMEAHRLSTILARGEGLAEHLQFIGVFSDTELVRIDTEEDSICWEAFTPMEDNGLSTSAVMRVMAGSWEQAQELTAKLGQPKIAEAIPALAAVL